MHMAELWTSGHGRASEDVMCAEGDWRRCHRRDLAGATVVYDGGKLTIAD